MREITPEQQEAIRTAVNSGISEKTRKKYGIEKDKVLELKDDKTNDNDFYKIKLTDAEDHILIFTASKKDYERIYSTHHLPDFTKFISELLSNNYFMREDFKVVTIPNNAASLQGSPLTDKVNRLKKFLA